MPCGTEPRRRRPPVLVGSHGPAGFRVLGKRRGRCGPARPRVENRPSGVDLVGALWAISDSRATRLGAAHDPLNMDPIDRARQWDPLESGDLATVLSGFGARWWVGGGLALDLFVGGRSREHFDVDVWILRRDGPELRRHLAGWDLRAGLPGQTDESKFPVFAQQFDGDRAAYGVWATPPTRFASRLEFLLQDALGECWQSRYCPSVVLPLTEVGLEGAGGVPIVRPELVLLSKSLRRREVDSRDFRMIVPELEPARRRYLARLLTQIDPRHPWLSALEDVGDGPS